MSVIDIKAVASRMATMAEPTLLMMPAERPSFSKLGGSPDSTSNLAWPSANGVSKRFLAQIDLEAVRVAGGPSWLPPNGLLYFFCSEDLGAPDNVSVLYTPHRGTTPTDPVNRASPKERPLAFTKLTSIPSLEWLGVEGPLRGERRDWAEVEGLATGWPEKGPRHRIGGFPDEIQSEPMARSCELAAHEIDGRAYPASNPETVWRLLLQVDSDPGLRMNWGDDGALYVFIRQEDARAGDFSRTVTLSQMH